MSDQVCRSKAGTSIFASKIWSTSHYVLKYFKTWASQYFNLKHRCFSKQSLLCIVLERERQPFNLIHLIFGGEWCGSLMTSKLRISHPQNTWVSYLVTVLTLTLYGSRPYFLNFPFWNFNQLYPSFTLLLCKFGFQFKQSFIWIYH